MAKRTVNYQRALTVLNKIFKGANEHFFDNELEMPTITIQSTAGAYGHITVSKVWENADGVKTYELNIGADTLARPIENVVATMLHEMVHLYHLMNGIKDCSGYYHNKRFKDTAESMAKLSISRHEKYGWTITEPTEETIDFIVAYGFDDILINRNGMIDFTGISVGGSNSGAKPTPVKKPTKPSSTRKYICPCCGSSFRATRNLNVMCMDCDEQFVLA